MYFVRNWLAIGTTHEATQPELLAGNDIGAVLMLAYPKEQPTVPSLYLRVQDGKFIMPRTIAQGISFLHDQRNWGRRILITDDTAISRAPTFAIAVLKDKGKHDLVNAYRSVLRAHPNAMPHPMYWDSLCTYFEDEPDYDVLWFHIRMLMSQYAK